MLSFSSFTFICLNRNRWCVNPVLAKVLYVTTSRNSSKKKKKGIGKGLIIVHVILFWI